jgi:hypothetical protein
MRAVLRPLLVVASAGALVFALGHLVYQYVLLTEAYGRLLVFW